MLRAFERAPRKILRNQSQHVLHCRAAALFDVVAIYGYDICAYRGRAANARAGHDDFLVTLGVLGAWEVRSHEAIAGDFNAGCARRKKLRERRLRREASTHRA